MRSAVINLIALGVSAGVICSDAFLTPTLLPGGSTSSAAYRHARSYPSARGQQHRLLLRRESSMVAVTALRMSDKGEEEPAASAEPAPEEEAAAADAAEMPNVADLMEKAQEDDYVARATTSNVMGPAMQPEEDKKKEKEAFELTKPAEENKWASGAFKRGIAIQAVVLAFVLYLQFQPKEVSNLAICAPFAKGGCVGFGQWFEIVFLGAPIPPM